MSDYSTPQFVSGKSLRVDSAYDLNVFYHIVLGQFKWPSEQRGSLAIFLQKGETDNFSEALEKGEILPGQALVMEEDLDEVMAAIQKIRG